MSQNTKEFPLEAEELLGALRDAHAHATGERSQAGRVRRVPVPQPVHGIPPETIRRIRRDLDMTQEEFARLLNVPTVTARSWESGTRNPSGAALRLLQIARTHPEALVAAAT